MSLQKGRVYRVWTEREEDALRAGVSNFGLGAWEKIRLATDLLR